VSNKNRCKTIGKSHRLHPVPTWRSHMHRIGTTLLGLGGMVLAGGLANYALSVREWQIEGVDPFLRKAINEELAAMQPLDFLHARPAQLRRRLLATLPDLADVQITRRLPDWLHITGVARHPIAIWQQGETLKLVDEHGAVFISQRKHMLWDLPILRAGPQRLAPASQLLGQLRRMDARRYATLSECMFLAPGTWALYFSHGQRWLLPADATANQRLRTLLAMLGRPRWKDRTWRVDTRMDTRWFFRQSGHQGGTI